jgi:hypothetical protein
MEQLEQHATSTAVQYGVLGIVALAFALAIIQLFKMMRADQAAAKAEAKEMIKERDQWAVEREKLQINCEQKLRTAVEKYADALLQEREANREHEDLVRKEFAELMEKVAAESGRAAQATVDMMQKFYDRFVGPSRGR